MTGSDKMKRGDIVTVATQGDYGKPRPAVVVQNDDISRLDSVILCLMTSELKDARFRITLDPSAETGLEKISQVMTDKIVTVPKSKVGKVLGKVPDYKMKDIEQGVLFILGFSNQEHQSPSATR